MKYFDYFVSIEKQTLLKNIVFINEKQVVNQTTLTTNREKYYLKIIEI